MKPIIKIIIPVLLVASCSEFLGIRPEGTTPAEGIDYSKSENIFKPVSAAYASMRSGNVHAFPYICAFEITSDNADKGSSPEDNPTALALDKFTYDASNSLINDLWVGYYDVVSAANNAISQMPLFRNAIQNAQTRITIDQCEAEARVIRAYSYFNLVRLFGSVPLVDTVMTADQLASLRQTSRDEVYQFIANDLDYAISVLPVAYPSAYAGRITAYTARAIKAKVMMYTGDWTEVAKLTDEIITSGRFGLMADFREVFSIDGENGKESLFEIQSSTLGGITGTAPYIEYAYVQGPRGNSPANMQGWGFCTPSENLIEFYQSRNEVVRPATTLLYRGTITPEGDEIKASCTNPVYNGKCYTPSIYNNWSNNGYGYDHNVRVLRYAEVLLMYAEALLNGAPVGDSGFTADHAVNLVRNRAQLQPLSGVTLQNVWDERRAELALEEDRFFDLIRTGQASEVLSPNGFTTGKNEIFPIPANQRQLNPNLVQNPGY
ncbi:MAG: RagB/SusD family nutrient uptake outer membrane protein [Bacteroidales bacterium]|nr:RagB/SusD family nutrient uptake outer membrane protein [Bacteroidales bacterium]